jgi:capsid protein
MSELDQHKLLDSSRRRVNRKWQTNVAKDFDELISDLDYKTVQSGSRRLYANHGIVKGAIQQKATYSVGQAFLPRFLGTNKNWKSLATDWLSKWYQICSVNNFDFQTVLYLTSVTVDRDGDAFIMLTETKSGYPKIQCVPSHQIGQRNDAKRVTEGTYKGLKIRKGIITAKTGQPVAYRVLGETEADDKDVSALDMIHIFDPEYFEQSRGLGLFSHAINQFKDMADSTDKEMMAQLLLASIAFVEHNPFGGPDDFNAVDSYYYTSPDGKPTCEVFDDGTIKFFKSGDGSKLEPVSNNRPSAEYQAFHERLERIALVGTGWPKVLLDAAQGNGTADRVALRQGQKACEDRQSLLKPVALRIINYALSKAIKNGLLEFDPDFYKWGFSTPPALSIDFGKDSSAIREEYKLGLRNLTDILEEQGKSLDDHLYQRATEEAQAQLIREEVEKQYNVIIDPLNMRLTNPAQYQKTGEAPEQEAA